MATNPLHPIVGPEDYISPYTDINYSKGPKIIYGDVDVLTIVLNDSQGDSDDEWGNTEQIALRMIIDEAIAAHKELFGWSGILGLQDKFQALLGFFANFESNNFLNPEFTVFTIGNTQLSDGLLVLGTGAQYSPTGFTLSNGFALIAGVPFLQGAQMSVGIGLLVEMYYGYGADPHVKFTLDPSSIYDFAQGGLTCPPGASVNAGAAFFSGSLTAGDGHFTTIATQTSLEIGTDVYDSTGITFSGTETGNQDDVFIHFPTQTADLTGNSFIHAFIPDVTHPSNLEEIDIRSNYISLVLENLVGGTPTPVPTFYFTKVNTGPYGSPANTDYVTANIDGSFRLLGNTLNNFFIDGFPDAANGNHLTANLSFCNSGGGNYATQLKVFVDETVTPQARTIFSFSNNYPGVNGPSLFVFNDLANIGGIPFNMRIFSNDFGDTPHIFSSNTLRAAMGISIPGEDITDNIHYFGISSGGGNIDPNNSNQWAGLILQETGDSPNIPNSYSGYNFVLANGPGGAPGSIWILDGQPSFGTDPGTASDGLQITSTGITQYNSTTPSTFVSFRLNNTGMLLNTFGGALGISLDPVGGIGTGQNNIKWATKTVANYSWVYNTSPMSVFTLTPDIDIASIVGAGGHLLGVVTTVKTAGSSTYYGPGADTYYTALNTADGNLYFLLGASSIINPGPSNIADISIVVYYTTN